MAKEAIWIDVRGANEYATGHYQSAINIPHDVIAGKIEDLTTDKTADIHVYCRSGNRSGMAKSTLNKMGYSNVVNEGAYKDVMKRAQ